MEDYRKLSDLMRDSSTDVVLEYIRSKNINSETFVKVNKICRICYRVPSLLGLAIKYGHLLVMNELISLGCFDPNSSCTIDNKTMHPLHLACKYHRLDIIISLLHNHGIDIDSVDDSGVPVLVEAVSNRSEKTLDVVKTLVEAGASVNTSGREGRSPLSAAIDINNIDVCRYLLSKGADVNVRNKEVRGRTYLMDAIKGRADVSILGLLIESGEEINASDYESKSPLMYAMNVHANLHIVQFLLESGADVNAFDKFKKSSLVYAITNSAGIDVIRYFLESGADVNALDEENKSPLCYALDEEYSYRRDNNAMEETVKVLIQSGAEVNVLDNNQVTPLLYALRRKRLTNVEVIKMLVECGAGVNVLDNNQVSPLMHALRRKANIEVIKMLVEAGSDVNVLDNNLFSPLMNALGRKPTFELYRLLVDAGAHINVLDKDKKTPLHYVLEDYSEHTVNIVHHLIESGADVNALDIDNASPLMYALNWHSYVKCIVHVTHLLLDSGAKVNVVDKHQKSPLHYAVGNSGSTSVRSDAMQILVDAGADVNIQDENGDSPLMYALTRNARVEVMLLLLKCGVDVCVRNQENQSPLRYVFEWFVKYRKMRNRDGIFIDLVKVFEEYAGDVKGHLTTLPDTWGTHDAFDMIRTLCTKGADIEASDETGNTVLHQIMNKIVPCSCAKCFNLLHYLIVELNISLWALNSANQTAFSYALITGACHQYWIRNDIITYPIDVASGCARTESRREEAGTILKLCVQAGYTPDTEEMSVVRQIEEESSTDIKGSDVTSLLDICCFSVRRALGRRLPTAVNSLPIPEKVKQRVKLTHVDTMIETSKNTVDVQGYDGIDVDEFFGVGDNDDDDDDDFYYVDSDFDDL